MRAWLESATAGWRADEKSEEKGEGKNGTKQGAGSHVSPPSGTLAECYCVVDGRQAGQVAPCDSVTWSRRMWSASSPD